ncbi:MAG TPA: hypothetical protein VJV96_05445 [Candidatus Angelobacter sp.]|nr:hypothetical protein [Candidatus Angelobacter sp.]
MTFEELATDLREKLLREELQFFSQHQGEWAARHAGEYVLIGRSAFGGFHNTHEDATRAGLRAFGLAPFLVRRIKARQI